MNSSPSEQTLKSNQSANDVEKFSPKSLGPSRQWVGLAKKTLSFQSRQTFSNVCCIFLCPILMVVISASMGALITSLIQKSNPVQDFLYCANNASMNALNIPYWNGSDPILPQADSTGLKNADEAKVVLTNFALVVSLKLTGPPAAATLKFTRPCVFWYGEDYPLSPIYERPTAPVTLGGTTLPAFVRDSAYLAQPLHGWAFSLPVNATKDSIEYDRQFRDVITFSTYQQRNWAVYSTAPSADLALIGVRNKPDAITNLTQINVTAPAFTPAGSNGLFGTIPTRYWLNLTQTNPNATSIFSEILPVPWYQYNQGSDLDLDTAITDALQSAIESIAKLDKTALLNPLKDQDAVNKITAAANDKLSVLPYGSLYFKKIDHGALAYDVLYSFGSDIRLSSSTNFPDPGQRMIVQMTQLHNSFLRNSNATKFGTTSITQGFRIMPEVKNNKINLPFGGLIGAILYPFGVSFLLPIFVITLVQEKEAKILMMMRMNGMKTFGYNVSHYLTMFVLSFFSSILFMVAGAFTDLTFFKAGSPVVNLILFFVWCHVQISLAFFFSAFFNKSRLALVMVFLLVLCSVIISLVISKLYMDSHAPIAMFIWPPFAFYRALGLINEASFAAYLRPYAVSDLVPGNEAFTCLIFLIFEVPVYLLLGAYFSAVLPTEFGLRRPWHYPITDLYHAYTSDQRKRANGGLDPKSEAAMAAKLDDVESAEPLYEDDDVRAERKRVLAIHDKHAAPLIIKNMRKIYAGRGGAGPKLAVKDVTFAVESGIVFGLLGPNGAGKTTLISVLTGLYEKSSGEAFLGGNDISTETEKVYQSIGTCPQFDIFWDDLTVGEHLYFLARLKGVKKVDEREAVRASLESVSLLPMENRLTKGLSGGEKRRLSIAMALLGNPQVVFLDEPTTGLDPEVRRLIWNIITEAKKDRTIVLTTHSMEEAEALCQRIGIMAKGSLRCLADQNRLKDLYGSGFKLYFNSLEENTDKACQFIESLLPSGYRKLDAFATNTSYEFPSTPGILSYLFETVEASRVEYGILDWGIGQTTLEEVFVRLITESDAAAEA